VSAVHSLLFLPVLLFCLLLYDRSASYPAFPRFYSLSVVQYTLFWVVVLLVGDDCYRLVALDFVTAYYVCVEFAIGFFGCLHG
jgi:hypothetical protein